MEVEGVSHRQLAERLRLSVQAVHGMLSSPSERLAIVTFERYLAALGYEVTFQVSKVGGGEAKE